MDENTIVAMMQTIDEVNKKYEDLFQAHNRAADTNNKNFEVFRNAINNNADILNKVKHKHNFFVCVTTIEIMCLMYKTFVNGYNISALSKKVTGLSNVVAKELMKEENKKGE